MPAANPTDGAALLAQASAEDLERDAVELDMMVETAYAEDTTERGNALARLAALGRSYRELVADRARLDWLCAQTRPHHAVILCEMDVPDTKWASVQRVSQRHNPHKVEWCIEGETLRESIDNAMRVTPSLSLAQDDAERDRSASLLREAER